MCLSPIKIKANNVFLSRGQYQPLYYYVPCGHCAECLGLKKEQWYLRNYWHCKECFDRGGYVLFDTLTYRDDDLPHLSWYFPEFEGTSWDYPCFCYEHYRNFMKRLRINLSRGVFEPEFIEIKKLRAEKTSLKNMRSKYPLRKKIDKINNGPKREWIENRIKEIDYLIDDLKDFRHWDVKENFGSFVVSEYGSDDYYRDGSGKMRKATFRPHYHMLFYVNIPDLPSTKLAEYVAKSWKHGKTDCTDEYGNVRQSYTRTHNTIGMKYSRNGEIELRRVSSYVAKYITKDPWYSDKINARVQYAGERLGRVYEEYDAEFCPKDKLFKVNHDDGNGYVDETIYGIDGLKMKCMRMVQVQKDIDKLQRLVNGFHLQSEGFGLYAIDPKNFDEKELIEQGTFSLPDKDKIVKHIPAPQYLIRKLYYTLGHKNRHFNSPTYILKKEGIKWKENSLLRNRNNMLRRYSDLYLNIHDYDKFLIDFYLDGRSLEDYVNYKMFYQGRMKPDYIDLDIDNVIRKIVATKPYGKKYDIYLDDDRDVYQRIGYEKYSVTSFDDFVKENIIDMWSHPYFIYFDWLDDVFDKYIEKQNKEKQISYEHNEAQKAVYRMQGIKCKK